MKNLKNIKQISTTTIHVNSVISLIITALCKDGTIWVKKGTNDWICVNEIN
jgi:hypothetical protein